MADIYQLKISLMGVQPPIWRRIKVPKDFSFWELHEVIQFAMGWQNHHLFEFALGNIRVGIPEPSQKEELTVVHAKEFSLIDTLGAPGTIFSYLYDFGDSWEHVIEFEKVLPLLEDQEYPHCSDGARNCPPEDCGGPWGYVNLLESLKDPSNPDHPTAKNWLGSSFDPEAFHPDEATYRIQHGPSEEAEGQLSDVPKLDQTVDFAGLNAHELQVLSREPFSEDSPLHFSEDLSESQLQQSPIFMLIRALLERLEQLEPIKLTLTKSNLPRKLVIELYELGFIPAREIENGVFRISNEESVESIFAARNICEQAGIIKKRNRKLTFTKKGRKLWQAENHGLLFKVIFKAFLERFNWGCFDAFGNNGIGQFGAAYSLLLLKEYGSTEHFGEFYAEKYFSAFPSLYVLPFNDLWGSLLDTDTRKRAFLTRNFYRNLSWWGLFETNKIDHGLISDIQYRIKKTSLLDQFIQHRS